MTLPLISLLVPAYNHEKYIKETIDSLIAQTYPNLELIVIDDGSKDNTFAVLKSLEDVCHERFANVHFETQNNQGVVGTLNQLLEMEFCLSSQLTTSESALIISLSQNASTY